MNRAMANLRQEIAEYGSFSDPGKSIVMQGASATA